MTRTCMYLGLCTTAQCFVRRSYTHSCLMTQQSITLLGGTTLMPPDEQDLDSATSQLCYEMPEKTCH